MNSFNYVIKGRLKGDTLYWCEEDDAWVGQKYKATAYHSATKLGAKCHQLTLHNSRLDKEDRFESIEPIHWSEVK